MSTLIKKYSKSLVSVISIMAMVVFSSPGYARLNGIIGGAGATGPVFNLTATTGYIYTPDGDSVLMWGYANGNLTTGGLMQYPGPTLIVNQGDVVTVILTNRLNDANPALGEKTSLIFPGQSNVAATGGTPGLLTNETASSSLQTVTYTFTATEPGTYSYQSGTNQELQVEMGLVGTLVVRPATNPTTQAYNSADTAYDYEYLFVLTEMDPTIHYAVERAKTKADLDAIDNTKHHSVLWFINGRNGPDTLAGDNVPFLPHQPYGSVAQIHPGENALLRFVNAGRDLHPFHTHGNHYKLLARDGRLLKSAAATTADLAREDFTLQAVPGATYDALWTWTGEKMGWDVFGDVNIDPATAHTCSENTTANPAACPDANSDGFNDTNTTIACFDAASREYCPDHGKKFPVALTNQNELTFGGFYSGSPFIGAFANLPPGEGGLNLDGGMFYMWHSHNEREIINNDVYPGGMLTMMIVQPYTVTIAK